MNKIKKKNSEEIKKKKEKFWAEKLINTLSLKGELIPLMGEKQPDFQFPIEEKTVGIELVRIYTNYFITT